MHALSVGRVHNEKGNLKKALAYAHAALGVSRRFHVQCAHIYVVLMDILFRDGLPPPVLCWSFHCCGRLASFSAACNFCFFLLFPDGVAAAGDEEGARLCYTRAAEACDNHLGDHHPIMIKIHEALGDLYASGTERCGKSIT